MNEKRIFTSESVTEGHPDKVCDAVSDAILDAMLAQDPMSRVACETCATTNFVLVMGEVTSHAKVDIERVVRDTIAEIGYTDPDLGFDAETCELDIRLGTQSPDIALGVDRSLEAKAEGGAETGAGDQGMMYGYAADETDNYMPFPIDLAHALTRQLAAVRKNNILPWLRPDGKSQVSIEYDENGRPVRIDTVVLSTQHDENITHEQIEREVRKHVIDPVLPPAMVDKNTRILINPTGRFVVGGPHGDSGLTGRKIIVDSYGGYARHGGGAFSGKDATKVDRSASYMARYAAKNLVAAGLAHRCEVQLSYAIGVAEPTSVAVDTFGTGSLPDAELAAIVRRHFDLRPTGIIETLDLRRPIYRATAAYGHFGRDDLDLPWERLDKVDALKQYLK